MTGWGVEVFPWPTAPDDLPDSLTLDEAFRSAFYMVERYVSLEQEPSEELVLLLQYLRSDPACWEDWLASVRRGLADRGWAGPGLNGLRTHRSPPRWSLATVARGGRRNLDATQSHELRRGRRLGGRTRSGPRKPSDADPS